MLFIGCIDGWSQVNGFSPFSFLSEMRYIDIETSGAPSYIGGEIERLPIPGDAGMVLGSSSIDLVAQGLCFRPALPFKMGNKNIRM